MFVKQFESAGNPAAHFRSTGPEIWNQTRGAVDALVAGVGTGGTLTGGLLLGHHHQSTRPSALPRLAGASRKKRSVQGLPPCAEAGLPAGSGTFLKAKKPGVRLVAVEPAESAVLSGTPPGGHGILGIGAGEPRRTGNV